MPVFDFSGDATNSGCAHVYRKLDNSAIWGGRISITGPNPKTNDRFGQSVSLESETRLAVSYNPDIASDQAVYVYLYENAVWVLSQTITDINKSGFGWFIEFYDGALYVSAVNDEEDATNAGSVSMYALDNAGQYTLSQSIKPSSVVAGKHFGHSFSFSNAGPRLVVGAKPCDDEQACDIKGSVHVFYKERRLLG